MLLLLFFCDYEKTALAFLGVLGEFVLLWPSWFSCAHFLLIVLLLFSSGLCSLFVSSCSLSAVLFSPLLLLIPDISICIGVVLFHVLFVIIVTACVCFLLFLLVFSCSFLLLSIFVSVFGSSCFLLHFVLLHAVSCCLLLLYLIILLRCCCL